MEVADGAPVIDAHHHFWRMGHQEQPWRNSSHGAIARDYEPSDLAGEMLKAGVDGTVLVQSADSAAENDLLLHYATSCSTVRGVVAWLPVRRPREALRELQRIQSEHVRGVRCLIGRDPLDWLDSPDVVGLFRHLAEAGLAWDVVPVTAEQVQAVTGLAKAVPHLTIVIDHLCRPPVDGGGWEPWAGHVARLGLLPNVVMKVSVGVDVLTAWDAWRGEELARYVGWAVEQFGPSRLMLASNWPVVLLRTSYVDAVGDLRTALATAGLRGSELAAVAGGSAVRWYGLPQARE